MGKAEDRAMYAQFVNDNRYCWACILQPLPGDLDYPTRKLENAHIVGGPGRKADRRSLTRLCKCHHDLQEGHSIRHEGDLLPRLTRANMLWLKKRFDPVYYDVEFLNQCAIGTMPEPEAPDPIF